MREVLALVESALGASVLEVLAQTEPEQVYQAAGGLARSLVVVAALKEAGSVTLVMVSDLVTGPVPTARWVQPGADRQFLAA